MSLVSVAHIKVLLWRCTHINIRRISIIATTRNKTMENLESNPYFEKYSKRIAELQRASPEEYKRRVETVTTKQSKSNTPAGIVDTRQYSSVLNPKQALKGNVSAEDRKLDTIFKTELVKDKDTVEIQNIWERYHRDKEVISATIPVELYTGLQNKMREYPTFLFPLPRSQGYEFILCQNQGHTVHFTPLLAFQVHKENAPECLTVVHYTELQDKNIILMRGEYDKNVLTGQEAQCLANQFQMYYSGKDPHKLQLLEKFTNAPDSFKHMDLITQMENIALV